MYSNKTILITGGTGSWGHELTKQLLTHNVKEIRIFSRNELAQVEMERLFHSDKLTFIIGDIRDKEALRHATEDVDYVFHLAALKHVPVCEHLPEEAIKTNILGTMNVIHASIDNKVKKVIDVSTDKAVAPLNLYGMTKGIAERLIIEANTLSKDTKFVCIRAGNVLGSNGSVVPLFIDQIKNNNQITLTHKEMTRYFLTIPEAVTLLFKAAEHSIGGEIFVMKMPACRIIDLAKVLIDRYGNDKTNIIEVGIRSGEKLHEELISHYELNNVYEYDINYYLILPPTLNEKLNVHYMNYKKLSKLDAPVSSIQQNLMNFDEIKELLERGEFISFDR